MVVLGSIPTFSFHFRGLFKKEVHCYSESLPFHNKPTRLLRLKTEMVWLYFSYGSDQILVFFFICIQSNKYI